MQGLPPFEASTASDLVRDFSPPPHVFEHGDQLPYELHSQSTGHGLVLQVSTSANSPWHVRPPFEAGTSIDLVRDFFPPPHDFEHGDHWP